MSRGRLIASIQTTGSRGPADQSARAPAPEGRCTLPSSDGSYKRRFPSQQAALAFAAEQASQGAGWLRGSRAYRCRFCKGWHLTRQGLRRAGPPR
jgi:hypothetical protein